MSKATYPLKLPASIKTAGMVASRNPSNRARRTPRSALCNWLRRAF